MSLLQLNRAQMEKDRLERLKRKRQDQGLDDEDPTFVNPPPSKKPASSFTSFSALSHSSLHSLSAIQPTINPRAGELTYANGALRLSRTPGRTAVNSISPGDLIHPEKLVTAFIHFYVIESSQLMYFPLKTTPYFRPQCEVHVSSDFFMDSMAMMTTGIMDRKKSAVKEPEFNIATQLANAEYKHTYGSNYNAIYPYMKGGCSHSKIMVLVYDKFVRVVITSANFMLYDTRMGDNHCQNDFEYHLFSHLRDLGCPKAFVKSLRQFDFSPAKARLIISKPGKFTSDRKDFGQLRLKKVVRDILAENPAFKAQKKRKIALDVCTGSVGKLEVENMLSNLLESCAGGSQVASKTNPAVKILFPTRKDVENSSMGDQMASNIGCHVKWATAPTVIKNLFHHYVSTDPGMLFHMKFILAYYDEDVSASYASAPAPIYIYCGSHNFSTNAYGRIEDGALSKIMNYECGVVIRGQDLEEMVNGHWSEIVPFRRPTAASAYDLETEKPWNSPVWCQT